MVASPTPRSACWRKSCYERNDARSITKTKVRRQSNGRSTLATSSVWFELGRVRLRRSARAAEPHYAGEGAARSRRSERGLTFCLSLPLDYPAATCAILARHPPRPSPDPARRQPNFNCTPADDAAPTSSNDDLAILHLQYSTQMDSLAHVGALFDADGDGRASGCSTTGFGRARKSSVRAKEAARAERSREHLARARAGHREHGGAWCAGPWRDD